MLAKLFNFLQFEQQLLQEMIRLAERQKVALVKFNIKELEEITSFQEELAKSLRQAEEQRIAYLMSWLNISRTEALKLKLSTIEKQFPNEDTKELRKLKRNLAKLVNILQDLNLTNRVLANRAKSNVSNILAVLSNGNNYVCNVQI
ncbi:MAG TPA: flagellar protein FlgN [Candidatus Kapabacteria bacterium]|jgi:flagellar biosynthesis/type III secretory pathway chaperone|nr:flagellar protein FlgN [Candidatus Kapabacteria bacterium]HOM05645.1 flagellar protein FlgN [Candidatus Kapabacteria bacterium]HOQ49966.1 flagellar protein FlgN [Candidatus Kapabacteria bacterium]